MVPEEFAAYNSLCNWIKILLLIREQPHFYQLRHKHGKDEAYLHECGKKWAY